MAVRIRRVWMTELLASRDDPRFKQFKLPKLLTRIKNGLKNFIRMDENDYNYLLSKVRSSLTKKYLIRIPIPAEERLLITLRYLATGIDYDSLGHIFRVAASTVSLIVRETCKVIVEKLGEQFIKSNLPRSEEAWQQVAEKFGDRRQFKQCLGCLDGKHVRIKKPNKSESLYFSHKGFFRLISWPW